MLPDLLTPLVFRGLPSLFWLKTLVTCRHSSLHDYLNPKIIVCSHVECPGPSHRQNPQMKLRPGPAFFLDLWSLYLLHPLPSSDRMHLSSLEIKVLQRDTCPPWHEMTWISFLALPLTYFVTLSKFTLLLYLNFPDSQTKTMIHTHTSLMCRLNKLISFLKASGI